MTTRNWWLVFQIFAQKIIILAQVSENSCRNKSYEDDVWIFQMYSKEQVDKPKR